MKNFLLASSSLWQRELVRFFRQRSRVIGAVLPPVLFWFLIGSGLGTSFKLDSMPGCPLGDGNYLQYFFPGTVALIVLFTAIFSTISVIEDRHEGFLQSVLVAPLSREGLALGKVMGGTTLAFLQAGAFLCLLPLTGMSVELSQLPFLLADLLIVAFGLTSLGFFLAWKLDSTQGFHAIMNLFLIPMWLLSGALFPLSGAPAWLRVAMHANPLTYGVSALQMTFRVDGQPLAPGVVGAGACLLISGAFAILMFGFCLVSVRKRG